MTRLRIHPTLIAAALVLLGLLALPGCVAYAPGPYGGGYHHGHGYAPAYVAPRPYHGGRGHRPYRGWR